MLCDAKLKVHDAAEQFADRVGRIEEGQHEVVHAGEVVAPLPQRFAVAAREERDRVMQDMGHRHRYSRIGDVPTIILDPIER